MVCRQVQTAYATDGRWNRNGIVILNAISTQCIVGADKFPPMLIVVFLSIFVAFYSFTWAPLTWVLVGEVFPLAIRGRASGLASSFNWLGSFAVGLLFPIMTAAMPQATVYLWCNFNHRSYLLSLPYPKLMAERLKK